MVHPLALTLRMVRWMNVIAQVSSSSLARDLLFCILFIIGVVGMVFVASFGFK
jgi:hypothetical protein